ncbi:hypothetical protein EH244_19205 [Variovorax beijingensis]|uniref:MFS transporter n=1 Tax=Variovorax beijingensis TaxID=2496117 RepID=A0A3P3EK30_9BURK|nr:hypothetical protein EH244_19205 [Variovorax beijingensis]
MWSTWHWVRCNRNRLGSRAGGGLAGGLLPERAGALSFPWAMAVLALFGLSVVWLARDHGFRPGRRAVAT